MERVQLFYKDVSEIVGSGGFSIVRLTDSDGQRAVSVVCDKAVSEQLSIRLNRLPERDKMLPEVLLSLLRVDGLGDLEIMVYDVADGKYCVTLLNKQTFSLRAIRMSDAVLLHYISHIPLYMEAALMERQSTPYVDEPKGISIPINTIPTDQLNKELQKAVDVEDYRLASYLHEEIQRRQKK